MVRKRFLWDLSRREVLDGVLAFMRETGLHSGSILGVYDLYSACLGEWSRSRGKRVKRKGGE